MEVQAEESYKELLRFLRYYRNFGTPIIIGGWAVYFYNPYFGSDWMKDNFIHSL